MTLQEAIEIKNRYQYLIPKRSHPELLEADKLSIEALKAVGLCRKGVSASVYMLLPRETQ